jgi:regulator of sigma E protease
MLGTAVSVVSAIIGLGLLVVLHEGGHFIAARLCGMRVERFSIGFGPMLFGFKKWGTIFQIAPIPLGGFVQITGLNPHEDFPRDDPFVYPNRPRWMRLFVVTAGPLANFITAFFVMLIVFTLLGASVPAKIENVAPNFPAAAAGIKPGDVITELNGAPIAADFNISEEIAKTKGAPITLKLSRQGSPVTVQVTPQLQPDGVYRIGVTPGYSEIRALPFPVAVKSALLYPYVQSKFILGELGKIFTRKAKADLSGPLRIAAEIASAAKKGVWDYLNLLAALSVVLGILNLLPLPALDGGRASFLIVEGAIRRRINPRVEATVHAVGMVMLLGLLIFVTFKDATKIFGRG